MDASEFVKLRMIEIGVLNLLHPNSPGRRYHGEDNDGMDMDVGAVAESAGTN
jgi:hypothetical protein